MKATVLSRTNAWRMGLVNGRRLVCRTTSSNNRVAGLAGRQVIATRGSEGFTVVELVIAAAVFSLILMAAQTGFIEIGRLFYKGVSVTQTQAIASDIVDQIKNDIQVAANVSLKQTANGYTYYCVGNNRYTVNIGRQVDSSVSSDFSANGNFGLLHDILPGDSACAAPCSGSCPAGAVAFKSPSELLGGKMRLAQLSITQPYAAASPNLFNVSLVAVYGDDQALDYTDKTDLSTAFCSGGLSAQQFCSVSRLSSSAYKGVTP